MKRSTVAAVVAAFIVVGTIWATPLGKTAAQTINTSSFGCAFTAHSSFTGSSIQVYTSADIACVENTAVWNGYELGGSWYWPTATWGWYYAGQITPGGATDNWATHQICLSQCGQTVNTWVP
jgi:hypothetical protein